MLRIRRGDTVQVIKGDDRGKKGKVLRILPEVNRAIVEGVNLVKKHKRKTQQDPQGGIVSIEIPVNLSSLMLLCKNCNRPVKVEFTVLKDEAKSRVCKVCKEAI